MLTPGKISKEGPEKIKPAFGLDGDKVYSRVTSPCHLTGAEWWMTDISLHQEKAGLATVILDVIDYGCY